jgi:hypothetical protein
MDSSSSIRKVPLGNGRAYLWKSTRSSYAHRLVITAHGAAVNDSRSRAMESGSHAPLLHFYSLHGNDVEDEGLRSYAQGRTRPIERIRADKSYDYKLSKYTNSSSTSRRHNQAGETYSDIEALLTRPPRRSSAEVNTAFSYAQGLDAADPAEARSRRDGMTSHIRRSLSPDLPTDVVTISGRHLGTNSVRLSDVLVWLRQMRYNYSEIHCVFCR